MAKASITKKPDTAVSKLSAPARQNGNRVMKATWNVPAKLTKDDNAARATGLEIDWILGIPGKDPKKVTHTGNEKLATSSINLNNLKIGKTTYTRNSFFPVHSTRTLKSVTVKVTPTNGKGKGKSASATRSFEKPKAPVISAFSFNAETGELSCTITTDAGAGYRERYDTKYWMYVENTRTGRKGYAISPRSTTSTSFTVTYDASDYQQLSYSQYICVKVCAWARGFAGSSEQVTRTYYISYPAQATISSIAISAKDSTGKATVGIKTNSTVAHPVDRVKLEYLPNVTYANASEIPGDASPTETDIVDDAQCSALAIPVGDLIPDRGKYTWIRVKSWHAAERVLYRYSAWKRVTTLETPAATAADDDIVILSAAAGADGQSAVILLGWNADGQDDSTATELTWSTDEDAWRSTEDPDEYIFTWSDGVLTHDEVTYQDSARISIKNLEEGERYFIRARRMLEGDDETTYSSYSNKATVLTSEKPETVIANCDRYIPTGKSLSVYWTFSGNGLQTEWQIISDDGTVLAKGEDGIASTQISAERLAEFAQDGQITFHVETSTGSGFVRSEDHTVTIIDAPVVQVTAPAVLNVQPVSFTVAATQLCDLIVILSSQGAAGQFPDGIRRQTEGDTIHSDIYSPDWQEDTDTGEYTATVQLPAGLDLWQNGNYTIEVTGISQSTQLQSEKVSAEFEIDWTHQAADPYDFITITAIDETDDEGYHRMAAMIELTVPDEAAEADVYDIYRLTGDGAVLIGEGFPLEYTAYDEYTPFGAEKSLAYRIAIRTADGDTEFADIPYEFENETLRLDWQSGFLELPYNLSIADSYKKDVEIRAHLDGSTDGYWNQNIARTSSLSTDVIKLTQERDIEQARQLARYAGPVFIRTPEGTAYEADVQVSDMSAENKSLMAIAIDATETGLTQEFVLPTPFILEDENELE